MSTATFAALRVPPFRTYTAGQLVANTGTWMRSIAQDWLVLELTGSPTAVGWAMACQFLPMLLLGMHGGLIADRFPARTLLLWTQALNGLLAAVLAALTLTGRVRVEHVYLLALAGGLVFVVDNPARQVFVNEVVPARYLRNAVALNAAVFQTTRLLGPAVAGVLIGTVGIGWAFAANALCYLGPSLGLALIRPADLRPAPPLARAPGQLRSALRHVAARPLGAPVVGWITGEFGARAGMAVCGLGPLLAAGAVAAASVAGLTAVVQPRRGVMVLGWVMPCSVSVGAGRAGLTAAQGSQSARKRLT